MSAVPDGPIILLYFDFLVTKMKYLSLFKYVLELHVIEERDLGFKAK